MKISQLLSENKITVSCELFPPKKGGELENAKNVVRQMAALKPAFMSVTYGAGGTNTANTLEIANEIQNVNQITALAHLTCIASERPKIQEILERLRQHGIENILALRGDMPQDSSLTLSTSFHHASDLMKEIRDFGGFCIGGACYPEGHPESESLYRDIDNLKRKVENGCDFFTTQMFFDNDILYNFMFRLLRAGIRVPVIAGIMPVTNSRQIKRICALSGTALPRRFRMIVDRFADDPAAMKQAGIAYATEQIIDLFANGVNHIHIYSMNQPEIAGKIMENLSSMIGSPAAKE